MFSDLTVVVDKFMDLTQDGITVKTPKKRAPVKRQATVLWESPEKELPQCLNTKLQELEVRLLRQLNSLEHEVLLLHQAMDHLLTEDSTEHTLSEDELN